MSARDMFAMRQDDLPANISEPAAPAPSQAPRDPFRADIFCFLAQAALMLVFSALVLDGGAMLRLVQIAFAGEWILIAIIAFRVRRGRPYTEDDRRAVRFGFWFLAVATKVIARLLGRY